jgi:hypothetical protein
MEKAGMLAKQMEGCENVFQEALIKFRFRVSEQESKASEAIKMTNIGRYSTGPSSSNSM